VVSITEGSDHLEPAQEAGINEEVPRMNAMGPHHLMIIAEERSAAYVRKAQQKALLREAQGEKPGRIARLSGQLICGIGSHLVDLGKRLECYSVRILSPSQS
jgi:hypothetical protein